jgi:hypothetical protein
LNDARELHVITVRRIIKEILTWFDFVIYLEKLATGTYECEFDLILIFHVSRSDSILRSYNFSVLSILPIYSKLIKAGLRVWLYRYASS